MTISTDLVGICERVATRHDLDRASWHLLDWLGTVLATRGMPPERAFGVAAGLDATATSALAGPPDRAEVSAFCLGALGSLLEMDDLHRRSILHAGNVVCPSAMAAARLARASGPELLTALLAGYEVALRIGSAASASGYSSWYNSSVCGVFGAAMAASRAMSLSREAQAHAMGHAGMQAAGLWQCRLEDGNAKQLATAHAARAGLSAARAAAAGIRAPLAILEGELGLFRAAYPMADARTVLDAADAPWLLHEVSFKPWTACRHTHPAIAAALDLRRTGVLPSTTSKITVQTYAAAMAFCDAPDPRSAHEARFSLQHCVAVAMLRGTPRRADFEDASLRDAREICSLRTKISLQEDPELTARFPKAYGSRLLLIDAEDKLHSAYAPHAPGDPEAPLAPDEIEAKFLDNCRDGGVTKSAAAALRDAVRTLQDSPDLTALSAALSGSVATERPGENDD